MKWILLLAVALGSGCTTWAQDLDRATSLCIPEVRYKLGMFGSRTDFDHEGWSIPRKDPLWYTSTHGNGRAGNIGGLFTVEAIHDTMGFTCDQYAPHPPLRPELKRGLEK